MDEFSTMIGDDLEAQIEAKINGCALSRLECNHTSKGFNRLVEDNFEC